MDEETAPVQEPEHDLKNKYLVKALPVLTRRGFNHLRIDDIARSMDISKATFYKHFGSKEEVLEGLVAVLVRYFQQATTLIGGDSLPLLERFQKAFCQSVLIANYLSDAFLLDLKQFFPALWERIKVAQHARQQNLQSFYTAGIQAGLFQPLNPVLAVLHDDLIMRNIMNPQFLMENDLTLRAVLYDYYELQKYQWLVPEVRVQVNDAPVKEYIEMMARKIALGMRPDGVV